METKVKTNRSAAHVFSSEKVASSALRDSKTSISLRRKAELPIFPPMDDATDIPERLTFREATDVAHLPVPTDVPSLEIWHATETYFGVRIMKQRANGRVTRKYIVRYRDGGRWKKRTIGEVGADTMGVLAPVRLSFGEARYRAFRLKRAGALRDDGDTVPTLLEAYRDYRALREAEWSASTKENYEKDLKHLEPWHHRDLDRISKRDANALYKAIREGVCERHGKNPKTDVTTGVVTATGAMRLARILFNRALKNGHITINPLADLMDAGKFRRPERRTPAIHADQLSKFWNWLHSHSTATHPAVRDYLIIMLFTGMRRSVVSSLRWENLSLAPGNEHYRLLPDQRGNKTRQLVPMPLPTYLVENVFKPRFQDPTRHPEWILPSPKRPGRPLVSVKGSLASMRAATGIRATVHSLRATLATLVNAVTGNALLTRRVLTHSVESSLDRETTMSGYVRHHEDDLRIAMNRTVERVFEIVGSTAGSITSSPGARHE